MLCFILCRSYNMRFLGRVASRMPRSTLLYIINITRYYRKCYQMVAFLFYECSSDLLEIVLLIRSSAFLSNPELNGRKNFNGCFTKYLKISL